MTSQPFNCPNCGAPIDYDGSEIPTVRCPFCDTSVIVPPELRPAKFYKVKPETGTQPAVRSSGCSGTGIILVVLAIIFVGVMVGLPIYLSNLAVKSADTIVQNVPALKEVTTIAEVLTHMSANTPTPPPSPTPTPAFAEPELQFGEKGIGAGMFNDARFIAVDGNNIVYVADFDGGRVQAFDATGKYLTQWKIGTAKTIIDGMTANHNGEVFVASDNAITRVEGMTGKLLDKWVNPDGGTFGDMAVGPDGSLAATWYEGRWGLITSLEGHRDDLVIFDPQGKISLTIPSVVSGKTDSLALDNYVTIDGQGSIYILSDSVIYKYTPQGKFVDRFGSSGDQPDQLRMADAMIVDGQGRLNISDGNVIKIFSSEGRYITYFPTKYSVDQMVFDTKGDMWSISRDKVTKYKMKRPE